ncbi:MAG: ATP-dependent helicase [Candidatus Thiodiazotropha sp.]
MSSQFFEGAAGTGKTYNLMASLEGLVMARHLDKHQKVLALTFMHGSRARLDGALSELGSLRNRFDCMTFDAFAGYIVSRWRDLLDDVRQRQSITTGHNEYEQVCFEAAELLKDEKVQRWVSLTHPIVLVDEAQDLSSARLAMMKSLASNSILLVAADEYQHLDENHDGNEVIHWLSGNINTTRLTQAKRTNDQGLLRVANALREGQSITDILQERGRKLKYYSLGEFKLVPAAKVPLMSWNVSFALHMASRMGSTAVLSLGLDNVSQQVMQRVQSRQEKTQQGSFGPYPNLQFEQKTEYLVEECCSSINLQEEDLSIESALERCSAIEDLNVRNNLCGWINRRRRISGQTELSKDELESAISNAFQNKRRYQRRTNITRQAMTIHQAKNREFDNVIVLWTYAFSDASDEFKRRLLYNAITRAKRRCTVVVIGVNRINEVPFSLPEVPLEVSG